MDLTNWRTRLIFLGLFLILVILIAFVLYTLFFKPTPQPISDIDEVVTEPGALPPAGPFFPREPITTPGELPQEPSITQLIHPSEVSEIADGGPTKVTSLNKILTSGTQLANDGKHLVYLDKTGGKFYKMNEQGEATLMSDKIFHGVDQVTWAPQNDKVILEYPDGANILYDFEKEKQITLPEHWRDFSFSPTGENIALKSIGLDPDNHWLLFSKPDGSQARSIEKIIGSGSNINIDWSPNNQIVATYTQPIDGERQRLYFVGQNNILNKSTVVEGRDVRALWSPDGEQLLYSAYHSRDQYKPMLWIVDASPDSIGQNRRSLKINTWADKCAFGNDQTVYCAVKRDPLPSHSALNPAFHFGEPDVIYKINVKTGSKTIIANPYGEFAIDQIVVSQDGRNLYFTDQIYRNIHKMKLR